MMSCNGILYSVRVHVSYNGNEHYTTAKGAFDLLECLLQKAGVERDAKAAALRAYEKQAISAYENGARLDYQAGVITITNEI